MNEFNPITTMKTLTRNMFSYNIMMSKYLMGYYDGIFENMSKKSENKNPFNLFDPKNFDSFKTGE